MYKKYFRYIITLWCLLFSVSACASSPTPPTNHASPHTTATTVIATATSTPTPITDADIVAHMVRGMTLDQKLERRSSNRSIRTAG